MARGDVAGPEGVGHHGQGGVEVVGQAGVAGGGSGPGVGLLGEPVADRAGTGLLRDVGLGCGGDEPELEGLEAAHGPVDVGDHTGVLAGVEVDRSDGIKQLVDGRDHDAGMARVGVEVQEC